MKRLLFFKRMAFAVGRLHDDRVKLTAKRRTIRFDIFRAKLRSLRLLFGGQTFRFCLAGKGVDPIDFRLIQGVFTSLTL